MNNRSFSEEEMRQREGRTLPPAQAGGRPTARPSGGLFPHLSGTGCHARGLPGSFLGGPPGPAAMTRTAGRPRRATTGRRSGGRFRRSSGMIPGPKAGETAGQSPRLTRPGAQPAGPPPRTGNLPLTSGSRSRNCGRGTEGAPAKAKVPPLLPEEPAAAADPPEGPAVRPPEKGGGGRFW